MYWGSWATGSEAELVAEVPVDAGAYLDVSLLIGAAVGEFGDEVVGHEAEFEAVIDVVVNAAAEGSR